jgi:hypothetical protein
MSDTTPPADTTQDPDNIYADGTTETAPEAAPADKKKPTVKPDNIYAD